MSHPPSAGRRSVLAGGAVLAAGLAGCAAAPPPAPAPVRPPAVGPPPADAAGAAGTDVGPAADVPVGGAAVFADLELVVSRPEEGTYVGFSAVCTHTGCIVDRVEGTSIVCPCHGSRYGLDGSVQTGPAPRALDPRPVSVENGRVVLL